MITKIIQNCNFGHADNLENAILTKLKFLASQNWAKSLILLFWIGQNETFWEGKFLKIEISHPLIGKIPVLAIISTSIWYFPGH